MLSYTVSTGLVVSEIACAEMLRLCEEALSARRSMHICTVNPEIVQMTKRDGVYRRAVLDADLRTIDGIGIALAIQRQSGHRPARLTGVQVTDALASWAKESQVELMIVGAADEWRVQAEDRLRNRGVEVRKGVSPRVSADGSSSDTVSLPDGGVVLVALGAPKQELWIRQQILRGCQPNVFVGVGGAIDYLGGAAHPPPRMVQRLGVEWLYRLLREPRRRLRRQASALPQFVLQEIVAPRKRRTPDSRT